MAVSSYRALIDAMTNGAEHFCSFRKVPSQSSNSGWWVDLSMAAGNPSPNYYASNPTEADTLIGRKGIFHGDDKSPATKVLTHIGLMTPTAAMVGAYKLLDYLLYYPFVDLDDLSTQAMDNTVVTALPRYAGGDGVMAMLVCSAPTTGGGTFTFDYIDQDGNPRTSPVNNYTTASASIASLATGQPNSTGGNGPFLNLASGSRGIRQIVNWNNIISNGGLGSVVLVKPLADSAIREINTMTELSFLDQHNIPPVILDGAYLNLIMNCAGSVSAGLLAGYAKFAWN
jgi:hypothetical protein